MSRCKQLLEDRKNGVVINNSLGRIPNQIDWDGIGELCEAGCSGKEVASSIGMTPDRLYERCCIDNGLLWTDFSNMYKCKGDGMIRKKQYEIALNGDRVMLLWLGKQRLGQRENPTSLEEMPPHIKEFIELLKAQYAPNKDAKENQEITNSNETTE